MSHAPFWKTTAGDLGCPPKDRVAIVVGRVLISYQAISFSMMFLTCSWKDFLSFVKVHSYTNLKKFREAQKSN